MQVTLDEIVTATRGKASARRSSADRRQLEQLAQRHVPRGLKRALMQRSSEGTAVIAELKKASPSRGVIRADFDVGSLAKELEEARAAALSVLTDEEFFQGSLENLRCASAATRLPCLQKDFIVDEFQILEARANWADAVLLIVAALSQADLVKLAKAADTLDLDVLCEVHDESELHRGVDAGCTLIGVNSRDLRTFEVDLQTTFRLAKFLPKNIVAVAESGIRDLTDIAKLRAAGYKAFLIGESLMKAAHPGAMLRGLLAADAVAK